MCMLSLITPGAEVDMSQLDNGAKKNTDGYGWAIARHKGRGGLLVHRTMSRPEALETFAAAQKDNPDSYALFHSRWSTGGVKTTANCHPFQVGSDQLTVLAHNGIFGGLQPDFKTGDYRSDTAVFAQEIVPVRFRRLDRIGVQNQFIKAIGPYNKVAIVTANPRYRESAYLFNQAAGEWVDGGVWHSNTDYKTYATRYLTSVGWDGEDGEWVTWTSEKTGKTYRWRERDAKNGECPVCYADLYESLDIATGECQLCGMCVVCQRWFKDCDCLTEFDVRKVLPDIFSGTTIKDSRIERLALPPGSGSATRYGYGFDGEGDDDDDVEVMRDPDDDSKCWYGANGWCMSSECKLLHRLVLEKDGEVAEYTEDKIDPDEVVADFDTALQQQFPIVLGPRQTSSDLSAIDR